MLEATGRSAALLSRLGSVEPKLALSSAAALALAPLAAQWLGDGVSELEARSLLGDGLPSVVHGARALLADRLVRKLPAPRTRRDAAAPATPLVECAECRNPQPRGQQTGICTVCVGAATPIADATPVVETLSARVTPLRTALRARSVAARAQS